MLTKKRAKHDTIGIGLLIGLVLPILGILAFWESQYSNLGFGEFLKATLTIQISSALLSLAAVPNLAVFFILLQMESIFAARGIILSTLLMAIAGFILKFTVG